MAVTEHTLTEFLQHSGRVLSDVDRGEVLLRRRDGDDLVVMTRGQSEALHTVLRALAGVVLEHTGAATAVLPWLAFLGKRDRAVCLRELSEVARAAVTTGQIGRLEAALYQWEATGLAAWDDLRLQAHPDREAYTQDEPLALERPE